MFFFCESKFCREPLECCWHCGANSLTSCVFKPTYLFVVYGCCPGKLLSPTSSQLQPCSRRRASKSVLSVAHPPGSVAQRDLRADGRLPPCPLSRFSRSCFWEVWFPISVWFKWVQDIEVSRAAQHGFLGAVSCHESEFAARHCGNGCTKCLRSHQR